MLEEILSISRVTESASNENDPNAPNDPNALPPAAVCLEAAFRAAPDRVHPIHLRLAAPLAHHGIGRRLAAFFGFGGL
jgi:hypothetical protein